MSKETKKRINFQECRHGIDPRWCELCSSGELQQKGTSHKQLERKPASQSESDEIHLLSVGESIESLPPDIEALHVCRPLSVPKLEQILDLCPNLRQIEFSPTLFKNFLREGSAQARFLEEKGVTATSGLWFKKREDLDKRKDRVWEKRRNFLIHLETSQQEALEEARTMGLDKEAKMLERYFCLEEPRYPRISFVDLAVKEDLSYAATRTKILGLLTFLGWPTEEKKIQQRAEIFKIRLKKTRLVREANQFRIQSEEFRPIPLGLREAQWADFYQVTKIQANSPEKLSKLPPRQRSILNLYFGLENGIHYTLEEIGKRLDNITYERVRQLKNIALEALGIREQSKTASSEN